MSSAPYADPTSTDTGAVLIEGLRLRQSDPRALLSFGERLRASLAPNARSRSPNESSARGSLWRSRRPSINTAPVSVDVGSA